MEDSLGPTSFHIFYRRGMREYENLLRNLCSKNNGRYSEIYFLKGMDDLDTEKRAKDGNIPLLLNYILEDRRIAELSLPLFEDTLRSLEKGLKDFSLTISKNTDEGWIKYEFRFLL